MKQVTVVLLGLCLLPGQARADSPPTPVNSHAMRLHAPIKTWDEAIPIGNGLMGGLLWGGGNELRLSLDRGDLWDLRVPKTYQESTWNYETLKKLAQSGKQNDLNRRFDTPYSKIPYPTKLPGGRLVLTFDATENIAEFGLDMRRALGWANLDQEGRKRVECFFSATTPIGLMYIPGSAPQIDLVANSAVQKLGYEPAEIVREGGTLYCLQHAALGFDYVTLVQSREVQGGTLLAITLTTNHDSDDPVAFAKQQADKALATGWAPMQIAHEAWWNGFWAKSSVSIPDEKIQQHYNLVQYFYGAASRRGSPPMPLQGVWTADSGKLPPWKGDYHHDLNTQLTYWAYLASGRFDQGACFLDFMWSVKPEHEKFARDFYATEGLIVPGVMTLDGKPMGGWAQYSFSPCNGAWTALAFYDHWRYTQDRAFLKDRAFPYCRAAAQALLGLLEPDANGKLKLPLSSSPEIHNNSQKAWLTPNSNYDLSLIRKLFTVVAQMGDALDDEKQSARWRDALANLDSLAVEKETNQLRISPDESLLDSHRHFSHLMAIHPLGTLNIEGDAHDRSVIRASLEQLNKLGTQAWTGYSFSWAAAMFARARQPEPALDYLQKYVHAFILRNGFHVNGDQTRSGLSGYRYRPFTLEGNFAAAQAVHEMLLQSWSADVLHDSTPVIRIFPATPWRWHNASFDRLRTEGGWIVSARRENNATIWVRLEATHNGQLRLLDNFGGRTPQFHQANVTRRGNQFIAELHTGETLELTLPKPNTIPAAPENVTQPFHLP